MSGEPVNPNRIETAFASAKQRNEAAFLTFITAGYPSAKGAYLHRNRVVVARRRPSSRALSISIATVL
jgi:hypothetical protein